MELAADELRACCAAPRWVDAMVAGAPFPSREAVLDAADRALAGLDWAEVERALAAHPRIGERADGAGREARWSRTEQAAAASGDDQCAAELAEANRAYERRFGHVFLICASGLPAGAVLAALRERLGNDPATERGVVRAELGRIVRLRLSRLVPA
jgi:2-oxo-4-hydroxy-4-carboxy-5-ureidoimidazoline decarboxylase